MFQIFKDFVLKKNKLYGFHLSINSAWCLIAACTGLNLLEVFHAAKNINKY